MQPLRRGIGGIIWNWRNNRGGAREWDQTKRKQSPLETVRISSSLGGVRSKTPTPILCSLLIGGLMGYILALIIDEKRWTALRKPEASSKIMEFMRYNIIRKEKSMKHTCIKNEMLFCFCSVV